jgi:hypothetical protein
VQLFAGFPDDTGAVSGAIFTAHSGLPDQSTLRCGQKSADLLEVRQAIILVSRVCRSLDSNALHSRSHICAGLPVNAVELPWVIIACSCSGILWDIDVYGEWTGTASASDIAMVLQQ